ncbi:speckle-type POZ protein-like isoform X1 [Schistocerca gregaria]|uniref:speckle-type POZ protein-like isoform X1 n=2 Tax=Schistocerca gregaria TaxID=7010 RepID=UPI00211F2AFB|nr:speckle-type POZ protein-like isoform X1 [Schistocerca gregaria]
MGNTESTLQAQPVTFEFGSQQSPECVHEIAVTNFVTTKATFTWNVHQLRNWPKGPFEASSPPFVHPSASVWSMHLSKDSYESVHLGFILVSSEKGAPVRATIKTKARSEASQIKQLPAIESELFKVGEVMRKQILQGFTIPKAAQSDKLLLESEVLVVSSVVESAPGTTNTLKDDLATLLKLKEDADVTLLAGSSKVSLMAHSTLLRARSRVFASMLKSPEVATKSGHIFHMREVEPREVKELLCYIYTDQTPSLSEMPEELLALANRYDLMGLKRRCELELCQRLTVDNAARTAVLGVKHSCLTLLQMTVPFIEQKYAEVMGTPGWAAAVRTDPEAMATVSQFISDAAKGEYRIRL